VLGAGRPRMSRPVPLHPAAQHELDEAADRLELHTLTAQHEPLGRSCDWGENGMFSTLQLQRGVAVEHELDERKSQANKDKHGIDFVDAQALWSDEQLTEVPARSDDEPRFLVVGLIGV